MSELHSINHAMVPYVPRKARTSWRWGVAAGVIVAAIIFWLTALPAPAPPELPRAEPPELTTVPSDCGEQVRLAANVQGDEQQPSEVPDQFPAEIPEQIPAEVPEQVSPEVVEQPPSKVAEDARFRLDEDLQLAAEMEIRVAPTEGFQFAGEEPESTAMEMVPIPQDGTAGEVPSFSNLDQGAQKRITSEMSEAVSMAERGAIYAARARLIACLRRVARLRDAQADVDTHSTALAAAFLAMDEANDFDDQGTQYQADLLTRNYIAGHQTPVLKNSPTPSAVRARNAYYLFARKKLIEAAGAQKISAELLYALGRVESELTKQMRDSHQRRAPRELPLFEAAVAVNPSHHIAANELGVALARTGDYRRATIAFKHSVQIRSTPEALANLEFVARQIGDQEATANARQQLAGTSMKQSMLPEVSVVSLEAFNQIPVSGLDDPATATTNGQQAQRPVVAPGVPSGVNPAHWHGPTGQAQPQPAREARGSHEWFW